jgi:hypothetical protein
MGKRQSYDDPRGLPAKIVFGILSTPVVLPVIAFTNTADVVLSTLKNTGLSIGYNVKRTFNLLGENGVMGKRQSYDDPRGLAAKIVFGILSTPVVLPVIAFTNTADVVLSTLKNTGLSIGYNVKRTFNLLGENGVMGKRQSYDDPRGLAAKITFGILSTPVVLPVIAFTNTADVVLSTLKNTGLSIGYNVKRTFNLLGENGVMGKRQSYDDTRGLPAKIVFGILSTPVVLPVIAVTNIVDAIGTACKNWRTVGAIGLGLGILALGPVAFMTRKTLGGIYHVAAPPLSLCMPCIPQKEVSVTKFIKGGLNVVTLGLFSAAKKIVTSIADCIGCCTSQSANDDSEFNRVQQAFTDAINLAKNGKLPTIKDGAGIFRPFMRVCYGMRHKCQSILKDLNEVYSEYVQKLKKGEKNGEEQTLVKSSYNIHSFFQSRTYINAKEKIYDTLKDDEKNYFKNIEDHLYTATQKTL